MKIKMYVDKDDIKGKYAFHMILGEVEMKRQLSLDELKQLSDSLKKDSTNIKDFIFHQIVEQDYSAGLGSCF